MATEEKSKILDTLNPGAILQFPSHIMMLLGKDDREYYVISSLGSFVSQIATDKTNVIPNTVMVTTLSTLGGNGKTWLQSLTTTVSVK